jgi:hypothetical protein
MCSDCVRLRDTRCMGNARAAHTNAFPEANNDNQATQILCSPSDRFWGRCKGLSFKRNRCIGSRSES